LYRSFWKSKSKGANSLLRVTRLSCDYARDA
jgi:hypothetical protein